MDKVVEIENLKDTFVYVDNITIAGRSKEEHDQNVKYFHATREKYNLTLNLDKTKSQVPGQFHSLDTLLVIQFHQINVACSH